MGHNDTCQILGIHFFASSPQQAVQRGLQGGLVVVPAAPALAQMKSDRAYLRALVEADLVLPDSGLMVLVWNIISKQSLTRVSGLEYLHLMFQQPEIKDPGATFWVMPSQSSMERNLAWLRAQGVAVDAAACYVAPKYAAGELEDPELLASIGQAQPKHIFIALGGGVQERLGLYLKTHLRAATGIHCIGAAIGFLTGDQVRIPMWADYIYAGWFFRCLSAPSRFVPRYVKSVKLIPMLFRYRDRLPQ